MKDVVVTVPAYFNDAQREAACVIAGLNVMKLLSEPVVAALAFTDSIDDQNILIYDFVVIYVNVIIIIFG